MTWKRLVVGRKNELKGVSSSTHRLNKTHKMNERERERDGQTNINI